MSHTKTEGHEFVVVTREQALDNVTFGTLFSTSPYLRIEKHFLSREIPAQRKDLITGLRVYRVHVTHLHLLKLDKLERRFIPVGEERFVFTDVDPTIGIKAVSDFWAPVGP